MDTPERRAGEMGDSSTQLPSSVTACLRCREQKLKCDRERPGCTRCRRLGAICDYPLPPNRRGPRASRGTQFMRRATEVRQQNTRSQRDDIQAPLSEAVSRPAPNIEVERPNSTPRHGVSNSNVQETPTRAVSTPGNAVVDNAFATLATGTPVLSDSYPTRLRTMDSDTTQAAGTSEPPPLPPVALGLSLLEIYFTRIYNSHIIFYKPLIFQKYLEGQLDTFLLQAMFALATLFLHPSDQDDANDPSGSQTELTLLKRYHSCGLPWANAASKKAMESMVEEPSLMTIQALVCLQLYWFGVGKSYRANVCLATAYNSCHLLGYSRKSRDEITDSDLLLESELGRRSFWASWTSICIVMEPSLYAQSAWQEAAMVPLPGSILNDRYGKEIQLNEIMDEYWHATPVRSGASICNSGPPACLMKMMGVWSKAQLLCKDYTSASIAVNFDSAQQLSRLATSLFEDASEARAFSNQGDNPSETHTLMLVHDAIYHQSQIIINSMIVPLFSGIHTDLQIDLDTQRKAAESVAEHADLFHCLLEPYLSGRYHSSFLSPLVGYGAFIVAIVLLATEVSCHSKETEVLPTQVGRQEYRLAAVKSLFLLLDKMRVYWRALQRPWETLRNALQTGFPKSNATPNMTALSEHQTSTRSNYQQLPGIAERHSRITEHMNRHIEHPMPDASEGLLDIQDSSQAVNANGNFPEASNDLRIDASLISHIDLPQDYEWYSLSFADSGIEQFAGLEPNILFQQGWRAFG